MMLLTGYESKKQLKECIGEPMFGREYKSTGVFVGARRPHLLGGGREFFAEVTMQDDLIVKVR